MNQVKILNGNYMLRGKETSLNGIVFPLVQGFTHGVRGGYIKVDATPVPGFPDRNIKIYVESEDDYTDADELANEDPAEETDEEVMERLRVRFSMLNDMTRAVKQGKVRAMIVSGPPGVGKSHGVEEVLARYDTVESLGGTKKYEVVKGAMSALGLYCKMYKYADEDNVLVFDDCDSVFADELSLNLMKAALDSNKKRVIHWNTDSFKLRNEGIPDQFEFKGSAIFITNLRFDRVRGKLREHVQALESRCHYVDLTIDSERDKMLRIKQIVGDGMLDKYNFSKELANEIVEFVDDNKDRMRELSLRTVLKCADLAVSFPDRWQDFAENTVMQRR